MKTLILVDKNTFIIFHRFRLSENFKNGLGSSTGNVFFGTPKILKNAQKITNLEFEAHTNILTSVLLATKRARIHICSMILQPRVGGRGVP